MTNLEKFNEVIKETFRREVDPDFKEFLKHKCVCNYINCEDYFCCDCIIKNLDDQDKFWNAEYKPELLSFIIPKIPRIGYEEEKKWLDEKGGE